MGSTVGLVFLILLVAAVLAWVVGRPRGAANGEDGEEANVDREILEEAEDELRDLDAFASPDEADDHLPDWGPGAPKT
ncbi:MAG: hypothetical protein V3T20_09925 [Gemmatimonadota bacterium]